MTDEEMIRQVHQAMFGIAGTDEKGMVGDFRDMKLALKAMNDYQHRLSGKLNNLIWYLVGVGIITGASLLKVLIS